MIFIKDLDGKTKLDSSSTVGELVNVVMRSDFLMQEAKKLSETPPRYVTEGPKIVYVTQREYATVFPDNVDILGTDEMTTCMAVVIRNPTTKKIALGHFDTVDCVDSGLQEMIDSLDDEGDVSLQVHLVGSYNESTQLHPSRYSKPLALEILSYFRWSERNFSLDTCCILDLNTTSKSGTNIPIPIIRGIGFDVGSGVVFPASFAREAKEPDYVVRSICALSPTYEDDDGFACFYDTERDRFVVFPTQYKDNSRYAKRVLSMSDEEILRYNSTSPDAESEVFVIEQRERMTYLIKHKDWRETFPKNQPRIYERNSAGSWDRVEFEF